MGNGGYIPNLTFIDGCVQNWKAHNSRQFGVPYIYWTVDRSRSGWIIEQLTKPHKSRGLELHFTLFASDSNDFPNICRFCSHVWLSKGSPSSLITSPAFRSDCTRISVPMLMPSEAHRVVSSAQVGIVDSNLLSTAIGASIAKSQSHSNKVHNHSQITTVHEACTNFQDAMCHELETT